MEDLLHRYLEETAWIPYDYETRKEVCRTAFERKTSTKTTRKTGGEQ